MYLTFQYSATTRNYTVHDFVSNSEKYQRELPQYLSRERMHSLINFHAIFLSKIYMKCHT